MEHLRSIDQVAEHLQARLGPAMLTHVDLTEEPIERVVDALGALADSARGGVVIVLHDGEWLDDNGDCQLDRLEPLFPIFATKSAAVEEGQLWMAAVAGTEGVPPGYGDASDHLKVAERLPVTGADLGDLELYPFEERPAHSYQVTAAELIRAVLSDDDCLWNRGLATVRGDRILPTVAGLVACGSTPYRALPGMCMELHLYGQQLCWRGSLRELEARANDVSIPCLHPGRNKFRELLMNAVLHRSWNRCSWGRPIRVTIADERLEISHPGMLTEWQVGRSSPVNPMMFALASKVRVASGLGVGLDKVESFLVKRQLRPLELSVRDGEVKIAMTWPFPQHPQPTQPVEPPSPPAPPQRANATVTPSSRVVVNRPPDADEGRLMYRPTLGQVQATRRRTPVYTTAPAQHANATVTPSSRAVVNRPPDADEGRLMYPPTLGQVQATPRRTPVYTTAEEALARHFPTKPFSVPHVTRPASIQVPAPTAPPIPPREPLVREPEAVPAKRHEPAPAPAPALGPKELAVISQLKHHGPMSTQALMQALDWTRWGVRTALESLVTAGIVRGSAESANSPHQTYELV